MPECERLREALQSAEDQIDRDGDCITEDAADKAHRAETLRLIRAALAKVQS